jgi:hypothetical protein
MKFLKLEFYSNLFLSLALFTPITESYLNDFSSGVSLANSLRFRFGDSVANWPFDEQETYPPANRWMKVSCWDISSWYGYYQIAFFYRYLVHLIVLADKMCIFFFTILQRVDKNTIVFRKSFETINYYFNAHGR